MFHDKAVKLPREEWSLGILDVYLDVFSTAEFTKLVDPACLSYIQEFDIEMLKEMRATLCLSRLVGVGAI